MNFQQLRLKNRDRVSCYANAVMQCLLALELFKKSVSKGTGKFNNCILEIMNNPTNGCEKLRKEVGKGFELKKQNDAIEFLVEILFRVDQDILDKFQVDVQHNYFCKICGNTKEQVEQHKILTLTFSSLQRDFLDLQMNLGKYTNRCFCGGNFAEKKPILTKVGDIVVCSIPRCDSNNFSLQIPTKIKNVDYDNVRIGNFMFEVKSVILHHKETINTGHYTCVVRNGNRWIHCNDESSQEIDQFDPTLNDVCIMIMGQKNVKI